MARSLTLGFIPAPSSDELLLPLDLRDLPEDPNMFASSSQNGSSLLRFRFVVKREDARGISCRIFLLRYRAGFYFPEDEAVANA